MSKSDQSNRFYEFGPFRVDAFERVLLREGQPVMLAPKLFDTLLALVERSGHIVEKADLMVMVWPDTFVEESNLSSSVSLLRKTLGAAEDGKQYIETVARRGYRFTSEVQITDESPALIVTRHSRMRVVTREEEQISDAPPTQLQERVRLIAPVAQSKRKLVLAFCASALLIAGSLFGLTYLLRKQASKSVGTFTNIRMERQTTSGTANEAAISPDGKYLVHVTTRAAQSSLWLRHILTGSDQEIVAATPDTLGDLTFSPDGNHIFFSRLSGAQAGPITLHQVPLLGGPARELVKDIDTTITFSPDGKRFAFMRGDPSNGARYLMVANADGSGQQNLFTHELDDTFLIGPAWSPNGETIVFPLRGSGPKATYGNLMELRLRDGLERQITSERWSAIRAICWLRDGSGLIIIAAEQEPGSSMQLWHVSYPNGAVRRISNDVNDYTGLSLTADSSTLVTVQSEGVSDIWLVPNRDVSRASQITFDSHEGASGISWTPDGRIVFVSSASGARTISRADIWIMNKDGTAKTQLTSDSGWKERPVVSPDGRHVVYASTRAGSWNIWQMDIDGRNQTQLTHGTRDGRPAFTPDGKWIVYTSNDSPPPKLWKVPTEGGNPVQLTRDFSQLIAISPVEGKIAYSFVEGDGNTKSRRVAIMPLEGGAPTKSFGFARPFALTWAPDGKSLNYIDAPRPSIWSQPLDGGPPKQIIDFKSNRIYSFAWARDGQDLAVARGNRTSDVVLIKNQP